MAKGPNRLNIGPRHQGCRSIVALLIVMVFVLSSSTSSALGDTPTLGSRGSNCESMPRLCRTHWAGPNNNIGFLTINNTLVQREVWRFGIETATDRWTVAPGPQFMVNSDTGSLGWNYFEFSSSGDHLNTNDTFAVTWICPEPTVEPCYSENRESNIRWASIWMNSTTLDTVPGQQFDSTATHELGHAIGLAHPANENDGVPSVMAPNGSPGRRDTPQPDDIGSTTLCLVPPPGGVRCIYRSMGRL